MIQEILESICAEMQELVKDLPGATVFRDTQFDEEEIPSFQLPLFVIGLSDSPDMAQLSGGVTQATWNWNIRVYFIDSNAALDPDQAFSTGSYADIERIVNHFNFQTWLTTAFSEAVANYSFKMAFQDISKAPALLKKDGGMIPGYQISFSSISLDSRTAFVTYSDQSLQSVNQVPFDTHVFSTNVSSLSIAKAAGSTGTVIITANTPWIVESLPSWLTPSLYSGKIGASVVFTATLNPLTASRIGTIVLSAPLNNIASKNITVTQSGV